MPNPIHDLMPETPDLNAERLNKLKELFPDIFTDEGQLDENALHSILQNAGAEEKPKTNTEKYEFTWFGKSQAKENAYTPTRLTLQYDEKRSFNGDNSDNVIIEGENLEVLKLLLCGYRGAVKCIYIDPPYNTGNDFIYPDNYSESLQTYLEYTGQVDSEGRKFGTNVETDGRFHSKWLNMMYPRLYLARNLLREDGVIFIAISDVELANLIQVTNDVFGEANFVGVITRSTGTPTGGGFDVLVNIVDYMVVYSKSEEAGLQGLSLSDAESEIYDLEDERGRYLTRSLRRTGGEDRREDRPSMYYGLEAPNGSEVFPIGPGGYESRWICGRKRYEQLVAEGLVEWKQMEEAGAKNWKPYQRFYLNGRTKQSSNLWVDAEGNKKATKALKRLLGEKVFDSPKPVDVLRRCIGMGSGDDGLILDFFAGSGTMAEAVMEENKDTGHRRFILVQLPELTGRKDFPTIAEITKERVRRVIKKLNAEDEGKLDLDGAKKQDRGFRVFKLDESNFQTWEADKAKDGKSLTKQLEMHVNHVRKGRTDLDLLYEILLKDQDEGPTAEVETVKLAGKTAYSVASGTLIVSLERKLTLDFIRAIASRKPQRVVLLDAGFSGNDQLKANAVESFKSAGVTSFKTV